MVSLFAELIDDDFGRLKVPITCPNTKHIYHSGTSYWKKISDMRYKCLVCKCKMTINYPYKEEL